MLQSAPLVCLKSTNLHEEFRVAVGNIEANHLHSCRFGNLRNPQLNTSDTGALAAIKALIPHTFSTFSKSAAEVPALTATKGTT